MLGTWYAYGYCTLNPKGELYNAAPFIRCSLPCFCNPNVMSKSIVKSMCLENQEELLSDAMVVWCFCFEGRLTIWGKGTTKVQINLPFISMMCKYQQSWRHNLNMLPNDLRSHDKQAYVHSYWHDRLMNAELLLVCWYGPTQTGGVVSGYIDFTFKSDQCRMIGSLWKCDLNHRLQ